MYVQVSLPVVVSHHEGSLEDQQWFSSVSHVQGYARVMTSLSSVQLKSQFKTWVFSFRSHIIYFNLKVTTPNSYILQNGSNRLKIPISKMRFESKNLYLKNISQGILNSLVKIISKRDLKSVYNHHFTKFLKKNPNWSLTLMNTYHHK